MSKMAMLHADMEEGYEPSEEEMRSAALHHSLIDAVKQLNEAPLEWVDLATLKLVDEALSLLIHRKQEKCDACYKQ